jgi:hypothetical protein
MTMERKWSLWARALVMAAITLGIQPGAGPGSGATVRAATGAVAAQVPARGGQAPASIQARGSVPKADEPARSFAGKRDPFKVPAPPRDGKQEAFAGPLPPGKRGLVIGQLRLQGVVRQDADKGMIAVVTNQTNRAYFLRVHDEVYNGVVSRITAESIHFKENRLDNNGRPETRDIVLKLGSPPGEER